MLQGLCSVFMSCAKAKNEELPVEKKVLKRCCEDEISVQDAKGTDAICRKYKEYCKSANQNAP